MNISSRGVGVSVCLGEHPQPLLSLAVLLDSWALVII